MINPKLIILVKNFSKKKIPTLIYPGKIPFPKINNPVFDFPDIDGL